MKTIDFKRFKMFVDISKERTIEVDLTKEFADVIYKNANGIMAYDLAMRIYKSDSAIEFTDEEISALISIARNGTPIFLDSLNSNIVE